MTTGDVALMLVLLLIFGLSVAGLVYVFKVLDKAMFPRRD